MMIYWIFWTASYLVNFVVKGNGNAGVIFIYFYSNMFHLIGMMLVCSQFSFLNVNYPSNITPICNTNSVNKALRKWSWPWWQLPNKPCSNSMIKFMFFIQSNYLHPNCKTFPLKALFKHYKISSCLSRVDLLMAF